MGERFFADAMLGRLAKWMRIIGYDVEYESSINDSELVRRALADGRIVLTRDTLLIKRRALKGNSFFISGDCYRDQLRQVLDNFAIEKSSILTRCLLCNTPLSTIPKEKAERLVPPYVYKTQASFSACMRCGRIYWAGTHREKIAEELASMERDSGGREPPCFCIPPK
ncbi:MAG: Mut7-C RNAse domain-containing protein [Zetaproteobacteria bacterium]|nr:Mut7-C RNAse domain-containing protein [Zetaproteobacteria bacterium]